MSLKRSAPFLALLLIVFSLGIGYALTSPVLIQLQLEDKSQFQKAEALNVLAYHRFDNLFIAEFEKSNLKALEDKGLAYQIIDEEPWTESYYVISKSKRCEQVDLSRYGKMLVQKGNFYFLKISDQDARSLAEKGYYIVKVFRHAIPLKYKPVVEKSRRSSGYDPSIDSLLSLISEDSLYVWNLDLQNFQTRYTYSDSIHSARQWLVDKFVSLGIDSIWLHKYYLNREQYNVVATVVGYALPDKVIVVGGHYDSVVYGAGTDPYIWAPGADDNASGTVATLEMARIIAQNPLPLTVIFVPFAEEEQGLIGSYYFAQYLYFKGVDVHLMLNADMIGHSVDLDQDATIFADATAMDFVNTMIDMADTYTYLNAYYGGQSAGSDHYSFYEWGYDALFAHEGDFHYDGWHTNYDILDSLDFDYMKEVVKMELATLITVTRSFVPEYLIGDANGDDLVDVVDVVFLVNYVLKSDIPPDPLERGDVNCDEEVNVTDIIYLISYLFKDGPPPPATCWSL